jgi:hypothetical protein
MLKYTTYMVHVCVVHILHECILPFKYLCTGTLSVCAAQVHVCVVRVRVLHVYSVFLIPTFCILCTFFHLL